MKCSLVSKRETGRGPTADDVRIGAVIEGRSLLRQWLWRALRRAVTHTHQRQRLDDLVADADRWARTITPAKVLSQIGSPFAPDQQPVPREELNHAA